MSTGIEWTQETWNPTIGCSMVSPGCEHCYAINTAWIRQANPNMKGKYDNVVQKTAGGRLNWTGNINLGDNALRLPLKRKQPTLYFVNSMSDLFHPNMPEDWQDEIHAVMALCSHHTFQVLTKRPELMAEYYRGNWQERVIAKLRVVYQQESPQMFDLCADAERRLQINDYLQNIWQGTTVEDQQCADERIPHLLTVPAAVRWLSCEPMLGKVDISKWLNSSTSQQNIDWVVCGGETGKESRPMFPTWAQGLRDQCLAADVPFFFKQWGDWYPLLEWKASNVRNKLYMWEDGSTEVDVYHKDGKGGQIMAKIGKKAAGNLLDFAEYRAMPKIFDVSRFKK